LIRSAVDSSQAPADAAAAQSTNINSLTRRMLSKKTAPRIKPTMIDLLRLRPAGLAASAFDN
jgi:hypothetical protein